MKIEPPVALPPHLLWIRGRLVCLVCSALKVGRHEDQPLDLQRRPDSRGMPGFFRKPRNRGHLAALLRDHRRCRLD